MNRYNPNIHHRKSIRLKGYDYTQAGLYFITICCQQRACRFGNVVNGEMILNDAGRMVEKWYCELENKFPDIRCHQMVVMPNHFHCIIENIGTAVGADLRVCPITDNAIMNPIDGEHVRADLRVGPITNPIDGKPVRADLRVCPITNPIEGEHVRADLRVGPITNPIEGEHVRADLRGDPITNNAITNPIEGEHVRADLRVGPITDNAITNPIEGEPVRADLCVGPITNPIEGEHVRADLRVGPITDNAITNPIEGEHVGSPLRRVVQWFKTMSTNEYIRGVKTLGWQPFDGKLWQRNYYEHIIRNEQSYQTISEYIINNPAKWQDDKFYAT